MVDPKEFLDKLEKIKEKNKKMKGEELFKIVFKELMKNKIKD
jgi:hypothetical protein